MTQNNEAALGPASIRFNHLTLVAAVTAAIAATTSASLGWPVWAMFMGWVAFFMRPTSAREAFLSYICLVVGIAIGTLAYLSVGILLPIVGVAAYGCVVFVVALVVVSMRAAPFINNIPAYFLGMITFFASHLEPGITAFCELAAVGGLGSFAGWIAQKWQTSILRRGRSAGDA